MARILKYTSVNLGSNDMLIENQLSEELINLIEINNNLSPDQEKEEQEKTDEELRQEFLEQAQLEAESIIQQAQSEAEGIIQRAEDEALVLKQQAQEEGFGQGHEEGLAQGNSECEGIKAEAEEMLESAKKERAETIAKFEPEIMQFIIDSTEKILTSEYIFNPEIIKFVIKKGFSSIKKLDNMKVYVSPENYEVLKDETILAGVDLQKNNIEILQDETLSPNDCNIETEMGSISCGVTEQFNSLKQALYHMI